MPLFLQILPALCLLIYHIDLNVSISTIKHLLYIVSEWALFLNVHATY
jgi:hypothetical protein